MTGLIKPHSSLNFPTRKYRGKNKEFFLEILIEILQIKTVGASVIGVNRFINLIYLILCKRKLPFSFAKLL